MSSNDKKNLSSSTDLLQDVAGPSATINQNSDSNERSSRRWLTSSLRRNDITPTAVMHLTPTPMLGSETDFVSVGTPDASFPAATTARQPSQAQNYNRETSTMYNIYEMEQDDYDVNALLLRANAAPESESGNLQDLMKKVRGRRFYLEQFRKIQEQTGMNFFSLRFSREYEEAYRSYVQAHSVKRSRYCFLLGFISMVGYSVFQSSSGAWATDHELAINTLAFGVALPALFIGILLTFLDSMTQRLELVTFVVFCICGNVLIIIKPLSSFKGPILPLFILLIPIFGVTRLRFTKSCLLGWSLFLTYLIVQLSASVDETSSVIYQAVNYAIGVIGGMVSHYRQELLRRRNFALSLPFGGIENDTVYHELQTEKFSKRKLMYPWTRKFRHPEVEETFYRYWYLIDPFPYEHPNAGILHQGVFRVIRFAVMGLVLNQSVLGIQDRNFLSGYPNTHRWSAILRYGIVVPAYLSAAVFMYMMGRAFYRRWLAEAEAKVQRMTPAGEEIDERVLLEMTRSHKSTTLFSSKTRLDQADVSPRGDQHAEFSTTPHDAIWHEGRNERNSGGGCMKCIYKYFDTIVLQGGYVRAAQLYASAVISAHISAMGALLLTVTTSVDPQPVYYLGLLNAILFAHRSGFRVRFAYATTSTVVVSVLFIIATALFQPDQLLEYASYVVVVLVLGMMISFEEESLRRKFFVLKSIRVLEFEDWFSTVLKIQGWVREKLRRRVLEARGKLQGWSKEQMEEQYVLTEVQAQMGQASRYGVYTQAANVALGAFTEIL